MHFPIYQSSSRKNSHKTHNDNEFLRIAGIFSGFKKSRFRCEIHAHLIYFVKAYVNKKLKDSIEKFYIIHIRTVSY